MIRSCFGKEYVTAVSGGSHEKYIEAKITGLSTGEVIDFDALRAFLKRRSPGKHLTSQRKEADEPVPAGGGHFLDENTLFITDGTPLTIRIENLDIRRKDYIKNEEIPRPGHADYTAKLRYPGLDMSGGGPFSGRMTAAYCISGGIALQILKKMGIEISSRIRSIGKETDPGKAEQLIKNVMENGDSVGGTVELTVTGVPAGLGGAMFDGVEGILSYALFGIPAVKGVEFGSGFKGSRLCGSENNDAFCIKDGRVITETNRCGGILGGITDGMPITAGIAFKPTPSIQKKQRSVNIRSMKETEISTSGRHDPCIVLRAAPVCEAVAAMCILDLILQSEKRNIKEADSLEELREEIDILNKNLAETFEKRLELCSKIAEIKERDSLPVYDPSREQEILKKIKENSSPEFSEYVTDLFKTVFSLSRKLQTKKNEEKG